MTFKKFEPSESFVREAARPVELHVFSWCPKTGQQECVVAKEVWDGKTPTPISIHEAGEIEQ